MQPTKRPSAQRKSAQVIRAMMGTDNITCPSKAPVAGCAVGVPASVGTRGFGPQLAAARCELRSGIQIAWVARQRRRHGGMRVIDCPGERRVRENRMHGVGGGGRKRTDDAQPHADRWVAYRQRASRLPHNTWRIGALMGSVGCAYEAGRSGRVCTTRRSPMPSRGRPVNAVGVR